MLGAARNPESMRTQFTECPASSATRWMPDCGDYDGSYMEVRRKPRQQKRPRSTFLLTPVRRYVLRGFLFTHALDGTNEVAFYAGSEVFVHDALVGDAINHRL